MLLFDRIAEQKIADALARGELDDLPGAGRPLALEEDALVPEDLRLAYRILKNAGFVPREVEARREIAELERLLYDGASLDEAARARAAKKLALLRTRIEPAYAERVLGRLAR
ncbi:MAG: DnaJ family domain-containing protein [Burkholderiales bacterium]|nr:DnaJ family domain-containing protein [Burkholderiales bacterium]